MDNDNNSTNIFATIDIQLVEQWMRDYCEARIKAAKATEITESVTFMKKSEIIGDQIKHHLEFFNNKNTFLLNELKKNQLFFEEIVNFVDENDFTYLTESNLMNWTLCLIFPSISKSITKLVYDMHHLKIAVKNLEKN